MGLCMLLSETLHRWAADPVDWLSNAVSRRVGPRPWLRQNRQGEGVRGPATGPASPAKTLAVAGELGWGPRTTLV